MQYKVPQNIDKQDKIVGSLTLIEFSYLAIGGAVDFLINQSISGPMRIILMLIVTGLAAALAFLKIQDKSLLTFIRNMIQFSFTPKSRVWDKNAPKSVVNIVSKPTIVNELPKKFYDPNKVHELSQAIDTRGGTEEAPEKVFNNVK